MVGLPWWPAPPADWKARLAALRGEGGADLTSAAVALSRYDLGFTQTNALDTLTRTIGMPEIRLAVLGTCTTHHLAGGLRVGALRRGLRMRLYEPDYGQMRQDLADPASGFHAFAPTHVLFAFDADHVAAYVKGVTTRADAAARADALVADWCGLWRAARGAGGAGVLQQAVLPRLPASGGGNDYRLPDSGAAFVAMVNARLRDAVEAEGVDLVAIDTSVAADGLDAWFSPAAWFAAKQEIALPAAPLYGDLVARILAARLGRGAKCCVFDLDDTLWGGVVGDDGVDGIVLGNGNAGGEVFLALHHYALALKRRGILLAVNSKNDERVAADPFARHPDTVLKRSDFSAFVANWQDKASNLRAIAATLNIGLDSLVFVDDNPFEREQVRAALPEVFVPEVPADPALVPRMLAESGCFEMVALTGEDSKRADLYAADESRKSAMAETGDLQGFLRGLDMVLEHAPFAERDIARVTQLLNKTNQFNLATRRLREDELRVYTGDPTALGLQLRLVDRFGDNGIIAVVTGRQHDGTFAIEDWLMSCRVIGRDVEYATLVALVERLRTRALHTLTARYVPSGRNGMVADLLARLGFETTREEDGGVAGRLDLTRFTARPSPVALRGATS